ncbi:hypothetical protein QBC44DRAFT_163429 [Cladorrhinum sp. PSN332]|nr:hypothetical protein QBC44DRAFT_163429 [Cladorrhinum sp. PSN332]
MTTMSRSPILKHAEWESIDIGTTIPYRHVQPFTLPLPLTPSTPSYNDPQDEDHGEENDDLSSLFPLPPTYSQFHSAPYTPRTSSPTSRRSTLLLNSSVYSPRNTTTSYSTFPPFPPLSDHDRSHSHSATQEDDDGEDEEEDCYSDHLDLDDYLDTKPTAAPLKADKPALKRLPASHKSRYISNFLGRFDKFDDGGQREPLLPLHHRRTDSTWKGIGPGLKVSMLDSERGGSNCFIKSRRGGGSAERKWQKTMLGILLWVMFLLVVLVGLGYFAWKAVVVATTTRGEMTEAAWCSDAKPKFCHLVLGTDH